MKEFERPKTTKELEEREAGGFWKAIGLVNKLSRNKRSAIDIDTLCLIHRTIFVDAIPEIAGRYRASGEDTRKLYHLIPQPGSQVRGAMVEFGKELRARLEDLPPAPKTSRREIFRQWIYDVVTVAAWAQHKVVAIHPFSNGNGRTARLFTNLILQKQGLTGSRIKFEQSDKAAYPNALAQIDKAGDYGPLIEMVLHAMEDQYRFVAKQKTDYLHGGRG